jgi:hypothetical protein
MMLVTKGGWEGKKGGPVTVAGNDAGYGSGWGGGAVTVSSCSAVTNNLLLQQTNDIRNVCSYMQDRMHNKRLIFNDLYVWIETMGTAVSKRLFVMLLQFVN